MLPMTPEKMQSILEAALMVAGYPLSISAMQNLFTEEEKPSQTDIKLALTALTERYLEHSGLQLQEVANGYRLQTKSHLSPWLSKLLEERTPRYSRAFLETLAIIAYKQPITRAEIEDIRGVAVSSQIIKTLLEREWIRIIGYRDLPGKPAILGTTKDFLDYFNLKSLTDLPTLSELKNLDAQEEKLSQMQLEISNEEQIVTEEQQQ
jgi:segregation and condensation protein B